MSITTITTTGITITTYTAIEIAVALCGKIAAWHMLVAMIRQGSVLDDLARDIRAEISRSPAPTNTRKGAGKSLSNMVSLIRRAQAANVSLVTDKGAIVPVGKLEKACQVAEGTHDNTEAPAAPAEATATDPSATHATYDAEAWREQEDALVASKLEVSRLREAIAQASEALKLRHYKEAAKILLAA